MIDSQEANRVSNVSSGLVVYPAVIQKRIDAELPFMATEPIIMACVDKGLSRQEAHEEVRRLSHEAGAEVKQKGLDNDLIDRIRKAEFFKPILDQLEKVHWTRPAAGRTLLEHRGIFSSRAISRSSHQRSNC
jgi:adenylosuccinate lyase